MAKSPMDRQSTEQAAPVVNTRGDIGASPAGFGSRVQTTIPSKYLMAKVCHEVNRAYCMSLGDASQSSWEDAPDWQKDSAFKGVKLHMENDVGPEASHESWMAQKLADGWEYGEVKDAEAKTHPCLVAFGELPADQQVKDFLFRAVVHAFKDDKAPITAKTRALLDETTSNDDVSVIIAETNNDNPDEETPTEEA